MTKRPCSSAPGRVTSPSLLLALVLGLSVVTVGTGCAGGYPAATPPSAPHAAAEAKTPSAEAAPPPAPSDGAASIAQQPAAAPVSVAPASGAAAGAPASEKAPVAVAPRRPPGSPAPKSDARSAKTGAETRAPVIIYKGDLRMAAEEDLIPRTIDRIIDVAESLGGHVAARKDQSVEIKVPSASFREAMTRIDALGGVVGRSISADDVSEEFHDLEVRLANLRATRTRLQEFLARAGGIPDMLSVEKELERVAMEIDRAEGRLEFLRSRASLSTIGVALQAKPKVEAKVASAPPPLRGAALPIPWVNGIGLDPLLSLHK